MNRKFKIVLVAIICCASIANADSQTSQPIKSISIEKLALYPQRSAPATVISINDTVLSAQLSAKIESIPAHVGDVIERGKPLASLDCQDYNVDSSIARSRLDALAARSDLADKRLRRAYSLKEKNLIAVQSIDERESELNIAKADLRVAEAELKKVKLNESRCRILAPFQAVVVERLASIGQFVQPGTDIVRIKDIDDLEVSAQVYVEDVSQLHGASDLYFSNNGKRYELKLRVITRAIETSTRNQEVRLVFKNDKPIAGSAGNLSWLDSRPHLPAELLVKRDGVLGVFLVENGRAVFAKIDGAKSGRINPVNFSLDSFVVVAGQHTLSDQDPVE